MASNAVFRSMPAPLHTVSASAQLTRLAVARKLVTTLSTLALPRSPVCSTRRPMTVNRGRIRSNVARSQPAKIAILPEAARWHPPETGQSTAAPPRAMTSAPSRLTSASSVVDISIQILPGPTSSSICCMTASDAAGLGRQVMTASQVRIMSAGLSPAVAPKATNSATRSASRSWT